MASPSIQPPLLCQPWMGLKFSGSSPSFFPGLLHISFQQILLEDSSLKQSNIVQRVHTLQRLTNENAEFGSILGYTPLGNILANILHTPGTFVLYSTVSTSKYILSIPIAFCLNSWMLEPYLAAILGAF